jgi:hypothetical protein
MFVIKSQADQFIDLSQLNFSIHYLIGCQGHLTIHYIIEHD